VECQGHQVQLVKMAQGGRVEKVVSMVQVVRVEWVQVVRVEWVQVVLLLPVEQVEKQARVEHQL
jgi:hypothetical protein